MSQMLETLKTFWREEDGASESVIAVVLIGAVVVPLVLFLMEIAKSLAVYYSQTGYVISLPFP
jgi:Flp pilus assembly pilin Flp